jgi:hypothetical protein
MVVAVVPVGCCGSFLSTNVMLDAANPEHAPPPQRVPERRRALQRVQAAGGAPREPPRRRNPALRHQADLGDEEGGGGAGQEGHAQGFARDTFAAPATLEGAVEVLEAEGTPAISLRVGRRVFGPLPTTPVDQRATRADAFRRFVELLGGPHGRAVTSLILIGFRFADFRPDDARALFGDVLPNHPGLRTLHFESCEIDATLMCLLASGLASSASWTSASAGRVLDTLEFPGLLLDQQGLRAIAGLVTRRDSPLQELNLDLRGLGPAACQLIAECLPHNTNLRRLEVSVDECPADAVGRLADATSSLGSLAICASWTSDGVQPLATQLKTNTSIESIYLRGEVGGLSGTGFVAPLEDALREHNYSLQHVHFSVFWHFDTSQINGYLLRNRRIQRVLGRLPPLFHPSLPLQVWPTVLEMASGLPSLTYTLLRRGDMHALSLVLQGRSIGIDEEDRSNANIGSDADGLVRDTRRHSQRRMTVTGNLHASSAAPPCSVTQV